MAKQASELTALSQHVDGVGKLFSDSKTRHTWTFEIDGETQVVVVTASWNSGKFVVELNGYEKFHQITSVKFAYSFKFRDRLFKIYSIGDRICLDIDGVSFDSYTSKGKALQAAMLKSYEKNSRENENNNANNDATKNGYEPFTGQLSKRLGRGGAEYEIGEEQPQEDFFSKPIQVPSYVDGSSSEAVVASMTVIPDLIEFSNTNTPAVRGVVEPTSPCGVVTPRDKISPDHLVNPFAAFDELAATSHVSSSNNVENPFKIS